MLNFNVGPSKISENTKNDIKKAIETGVFEISHRSDTFSKISKTAIFEMRKFFNIPDDYLIFYTSSATESMELAIGNCCEKSSFHFVNGSFSSLFSKVSKSLGKETFVDEVSFGRQNNFSCENKHLNSCDFLATTQNETSTGVAMKSSDIEFLRKKYPDKILAVDITSSAGMELFDFSLADIWLFSVQKGFGLPAGLGFLIVSPVAFEKSLQLSKKKNNCSGYFSFENMLSKMSEKYQTLQTPNVFLIFLLKEKLIRWNLKGGINKIVEERDEKWNLLRNFFVNKKELKFFAENEEFLSKTIFCLSASEEKIAFYHKKLNENGIVSGKGYGELKEKTFRIANFPAISLADVKKYIEITDKIFN